MEFRILLLIKHKKPLTPIINYDNVNIYDNDQQIREVYING